jgi:hypothetical protein
MDARPEQREGIRDAMRGYAAREPGAMAGEGGPLRDSLPKGGRGLRPFQEERWRGKGGPFGIHSRRGEGARAPSKKSDGGGRGAPSGFTPEVGEGACAPSKKSDGGSPREGGLPPSSIQGEFYWPEGRPSTSRGCSLQQGSQASALEIKQTEVLHRRWERCRRPEGQLDVGQRSDGEISSDGIRRITHHSPPL